MSNRLMNGVQAGDMWHQLIKEKDVMIIQEQPQDEKTPPLQNESECPVMVGADVIGLYPNLDPIKVARITADMVENSRIKFSGVNFCILLVYLLLILGA